jgi:hypothetical protein
MTNASLLAQYNEEIKRRWPDRAVKAKKQYDFVDRSFKRQAEILEDTNQYQAWLFTRRFGKSTTFAKKACTVAANRPNSKILYLALTLGSAKGILWDAIENEFKKHKVEFKPYETEGEFYLKNNSSIKFFGVDSNYREMKKILGQAYDLVGIDESGSMTIDVENLIMQMIDPALIDRMGSLIMLGTAENIPATFYQRVTEREHIDLPWNIHKGSTEESPYTGPAFKAKKAQLLASNPLVKDASWFKAHYLNEWSADDSLIIIHFNDQINIEKKLPKYDDWIFGLGVDLGFNDDSSFSLNAVSRHSPYLYTIKAFKSPGMDLTDVSNMIKKIYEDYPFTWLVIDGANKQGVEEMRNRHNLPVNPVAAEKQDKATFLRLMDDDYKQGKIKHIEGECKRLQEEQASLVWIKGSGEEDPRCQNHLNDAQLYIWRKMRTYFTAESSEWKTKDQEMEERFLKEAQEAIAEREEMSLLY